MLINFKLINLMSMNFVNKQISYFFPLRRFLNLITFMSMNFKPENEAKENTSTTQPQTKNAPSTSLQTVANPTIMITPLAADTALTIPKIIVTPPNTAESTE